MVLLPDSFHFRYPVDHGLLGRIEDRARSGYGKASGDSGVYAVREGPGVPGVPAPRLSAARRDAPVQRARRTRRRILLAALAVVVLLLLAGTVAVAAGAGSHIPIVGTLFADDAGDKSASSTTSAAVTSSSEPWDLGHHRVRTLVHHAPRGIQHHHGRSRRGRPAGRPDRQGGRRADGQRPDRVAGRRHAEGQDPLQGPGAQWKDHHHADAQRVQHHRAGYRPDQGHLPDLLAGSRGDAPAEPHPLPERVDAQTGGLHA